MMTITDEGNANEKFMEDILIENLWMIEEGLEFVKRQKRVKTGYIDILAKDKNKKYVVIEIKKGDDDSSALGQIIGYMAALKEKLKISRNMIRGIIYCQKATERIQFATEFIEGLSYVTYEIKTSEKQRNGNIMNLSNDERDIIRKMRNNEWDRAIWHVELLQKLTN